MLQVNNLVKYYKKTKGVEDLSFTLTSGKTIGIIGVNGSGKTTTFRLLLGLLKADGGEIKFNDKNISEFNSSLFGYLPEERSLYKDLLVVDQVLLLGRLKNMSDEIIIERLEYYLSYLNISKYKYTYINQLSKGNQQKIQLICALIHDPKILILDEPLSGLDIINVSILKKLIYKLRRENKYILLSSHQLEHIEEFCDEIIILKAGDTTFSGTIDELKQLSNKAYISVDNTVGEKFINYGGVVDFNLLNNKIVLVVDNYKNGENLMLEILKAKPKNISIEQASIETIVKENNLI